MADFSSLILNELAQYSNDAIVNSIALASTLNVDHQRVVGAVKSLQSLGDVIRCEQISTKRWDLTDEGHSIVETGSHEVLVFNAVPLQGITQAELMKLVPNAKVGFSKAMSSGWIGIEKNASSGPRVIRKVQSVEDDVLKNLLKIKATGDDNDIPGNIKQDYKKRKLLQEVIVKSINISKGSEFGTSVSKQETDLTPEMIATGSWKELKFKPYNFNAMGVSPIRGHLHPLMRMRAQFRQIFLEMGFTEMPTNNFIESSFWNFDALFVPQKHPARDAQDTFFISEPKCAQTFPSEYLDRVHKVHEDGAYGSQGYKYQWKLEEAQKNVLRTHTTANSARMLYQLAQQEKFTPVKYFSIDRVFRNETLDATHLAEFFQIEGVIADYDLSLGDLIGVLHEFFKKLGITKLRFKPAYNPYTEPSMEVFSFHEGLNKWVEVGNSGIFRPEMLLPMGLPMGVTVIAWGLSLERPTMIKFGIDNIRDLEGHKVNLHMVYEAPICRLDKNEAKENDQKDCILHALEVRQDRLLEQLRSMQTRLMKMASSLSQVTSSPSPSQTSVPQSSIRPSDVDVEKDVVIHVSANEIPLSVFVLCRQISKQRPVMLSCHCHTSLVNGSANTIQSLLNGNRTISLSSKASAVGNTVATLHVRLVLHGDGVEPTLMVSPIRQGKIVGEVNVARYLARHLEPPYDEEDPLVATVVDHWLDLAQGRHFQTLIDALQRRLATSESGRQHLVGSKLTLADIFCWSTLQKSSRPASRLSSNVQKWLHGMTRHEDFDLAVRLDSNDVQHKSTS